MRLSRQIGSVALGTAMLFGAALSSPAKAGYVVTIVQDGSNVVATGSGSLDVTSLNKSGPVSSGEPYIWPNHAGLHLGPGELTFQYEGLPFSGPSSFGSGSFTGSFSVPNAATGNTVNFLPDFFDEAVIDLPITYILGSPLGTSTDTWENASFTTLGVSPGTYIWTWGTGAHADSYTLEIGGAAAVPEPSTLALFALPLGLMLLTGWRRTS